MPGGAVDQRPGGIVEQRRVVGAGDTGHKQVGVVARARLQARIAPVLGSIITMAPGDRQQLLAFNCRRMSMLR